MELVERYLQAVKFWLPKKQQDDIIAELSEDLHTQVEECEIELGRPLTESEIEGLLRQRGSPIRVANGYLPQSSLIGPVLFPIYLLVLKIVTLVSFLLPLTVSVIAGIVSRAAGNVAGTGWTPPFAALIRGDWNGWMNGLMISTLAFAVIERTSAKDKIFENWDPRKLPPVRPANPIPRFNSVCAVSGLACLLVFWVLKMGPPLTIHLGNLQIQTTPEWSLVFWAVLILTLTAFTLEVTNLLRPWWTTRRATARLVLDIGGFSVFCLCMRLHLVANLYWPGATPDKMSFTTDLVNMWLAHIFPWAAAVKFIIVVFDIRRLFKIRNSGVRAGWNPVRNPM